MKQTYQLLTIDCLQRGRYQPRIHFDEAALEELAHSIRTQGLLEPIIVRPLHENLYEIIAGERRWRAAILAGLTTIPCMIGHYSDAEAAGLTLVENLQRQELNLIEEACAYRRLLQEFHFRQDEIAVLVSKSRSHIANSLRLLNLISEAQDQVATGRLSFGHAKVLVGLTADLQRRFMHQTLEKEWSVRVLEQQIKKEKKEMLPCVSNPDLVRLTTAISDQLGAPVQISQEEGQSGWLKVKFFNHETLEGLLERMGLRYD